MSYLSRASSVTRIPFQIKYRAESLEADLDSLKAAFSEISRLSSEIAIEEFKDTPPLQS